MRRKVVLVGSWLLGGALAIGVATAAVSRVGNEVTGSRPSPLSATEVREELSAEASPSSTLPSTTTSTTARPATTADTAPPTSVASPPTEAAGETRTYPLVGGTATLRFSPGGVTVVVANPNAGFSVEIEAYGTNGVEVEFRSATHRSKVEAWWDAGPHDEVEERAED